MTARTETHSSHRDGRAADDDGGGAPSRRPRPPRRRRRTGVGWPDRLEIAVLAGPALLVFLALRHLPGRHGRRTTASSAGRATARRPTSSACENYVSILQDPHVPRGAAAQRRHRRAVAACSRARSRVLLALLLNRKMRGQSLIRVLDLRAVRHLRGRRRHRLEPDAPDRRRRQRPAREDRPRLRSRSDWLSDPDIAIWTLMGIITWKYIGFAVILFLAGLQGIPRGAHRGRRDRRRVVLADPAPHHAAAARADDPHLGVPVDHRLAAAVRPRLHHLGPVHRLHRRHLDDGDLHGRQRPQRRQLRLRQRRRRRDVPHLARRRADLPALRAAPRHRGRHHRREATDGRDRPSAPPARPGARRTGQASGRQPRHVLRRAGAHRGSCSAPVAVHHPRRLPHELPDHRRPRRAARPRGSSTTTLDVLDERDFWRQVVNSTIAAVVHHRSASSRSASWRATCSRATGSAAAGRCTRCSPPA